MPSDVLADAYAAKAGQVFRVPLRGDAILTNPRWNKGTAFTAKERQELGLIGRLPFTVNTLDEQCARAYDQLKAHESDLRKNAFMQSLKAQNWVLYYALLGRYLRELMPIIYTPTEVPFSERKSSCLSHTEIRVLYFCRQMPSLNTRISSGEAKGSTLRFLIKTPWKTTIWSRPRDVKLIW